MVLLTAGAVLLAAAVALSRPDGGGAVPDDVASADDAASMGPQATWLLVRQGPGAEADGLTLVATDPATGSATVVIVPAGTLVDIPGHQLDRVGAALAYGGGDPQLIRSALESALGIAIDEVAVVTDAGLAAWLERTGGLTVDVPSRIVVRDEAGAGDVRFEAGPQDLDGVALAELWRVRASGEDELATTPRQQRVWTALARAVAADPLLAAALAQGAGGPLDTTAEEAWLEAVLDGLGAAADAGRLRVVLTSVEVVSPGTASDRATYRLVPEATQRLVAESLAGAVPAGGGTDAARVEVLNGVGSPGIGAAVDQRLDPGRFRIVRSDNASSFDVGATLILVYDESDASLTAARAVRSALGVGTIQVSRQPQSVVDLTVVVGSDFTGEDAGADTAAPADGDGANP